VKPALLLAVGAFAGLLGGWIGITALTVVAAILLLRQRAWLDLGFLLVAVLGSQLPVALLKLWFDRPRPDVGRAIPLPSSASFPSGHAAGGVACLGAVTVLAAERLPFRGARTWLWTVAVAAGVAVGLSRIALGVHYVSDVLAGLVPRSRLARRLPARPRRTASPHTL
jgi:undecaprenyl-diphosphatase